MIKPVRGSVGFSPLLRAKLGSGSVDCESIGRYCQTEFQCSTEFSISDSSDDLVTIRVSAGLRRHLSGEVPTPSSKHRNRHS